jgi:hypothetical protein
VRLGIVGLGPEERPNPLRGSHLGTGGKAPDSVVHTQRLAGSFLRDLGSKEWEIAARLDLLAQRNSCPLPT